MSWFWTKKEVLEKEDERSDIISEIVDIMKERIYNRPDLVYKGIPLIFILYMSYPLLVVGWQWLPWLWICYEGYNKIPPGTSIVLYEAYNRYMNADIDIYNILKKLIFSKLE